MDVLYGCDPQDTFHSCCCGGTVEKIHKFKKIATQVSYSQVLLLGVSKPPVQRAWVQHMGRTSLPVVILVLFLLKCIFNSLFFLTFLKKKEKQNKTENQTNQKLKSAYVSPVIVSSENCSNFIFLNYE